MNKERFKIVDSRKRKSKPCAYMTYAPDEGFSIDIEPDATVDAVPALFIPFIEKGIRHIGLEWALRFVQERVPPSGRQNIGEILKAHGLYEYAELPLLKSRKGKCSQDDFMIVPVEVQAEGDGGGALLSSRPAIKRQLLGATVKARRLARGMSQGVLARSIGVDQAAISKLEAGKSNPTFDMLTELDTALWEASSCDMALLNLSEHALWSPERVVRYGKLEGIDADAAATYKRLLNEVGAYDASSPDAVVSAAVIKLCLERLSVLLHIYDAEDFDAPAAEAPDADACAHAETKLGDHRATSRLLFSLGSEEFGREATPEVVVKDSLKRTEEAIDTMYDHVMHNHASFLAMIDRANRVDASGGFLKPTKAERERFLVSIEVTSARHLAISNLRNPYWRRLLAG